MINIPQFTVSEFNSSIRRVVEDAFGYVKIKGEISGLKKASSGHFYFNLKERDSLISAVLFRNMAQAVNFEIGDGLEIVASGKITTFEGRSNYQIIVEKVEIAGIGAVLEMIEKRRQKLLEEGLFDEGCKKSIPFFPHRIGVITSQTGAVIEDIKHRISSRCPAHLMVFPASVQGDKAALDIISGIRFFNKLPSQKRPEVLIIARGGGSFEDLMPFNDEFLVREVFKSEIPVISAIGHETDTTLIDYVADLRAPTPSAAAEIATPILTDLILKVDNAANKLLVFVQNNLAKNFQILTNLQKYIIKPEQKLNEVRQNFLKLQRDLDFVVQNLIAEKMQNLLSLHFSQNSIFRALEFSESKVSSFFSRIKILVENKVNFYQQNFLNLLKIMDANHYKKILQRGFALLQNHKGKPMISISEARLQNSFKIVMQDGEILAKFIQEENVKNPRILD